LEIACNTLGGVEHFTGGDVVKTDDGSIYERVRGPLMSFATVLVGASDAGDVVSNVVVRTLSLRSLSSLEHPEAYLMKAVLNEARALGRQRRRQADLLARVSDRVVIPEQADLVDHDLARAVAGLPLKQRAAVFLTYWMDLDSSAVARRMGCRPATVRRYLHLARSKLERWIDV
jgi:RNA polymerase sigma factor (sigma-70 family)